jgi:hypothetical protein
VGYGSPKGDAVTNADIAAAFEKVCRQRWIGAASCGGRLVPPSANDFLETPNLNIIRPSASSVIEIL